MHEKVTVIVPYFQKETGILSRAISSALNQMGGYSIEIIVVDDSSPISAQRELRNLIEENPGVIRIVVQSNAGPAAARNNGLDRASPDTKYVAFLDSDDEWTETHIGNALLALGKGFDFYFADFYQLGQKVSAFNRGERIKPHEHTQLIAGESALFQYDGDMFDQILTGNIIGTSTVVYRYGKFPRLRFREEFFNAGEDYLFWMDFSKLSNKFSFSSQCDCKYGAGVNIYSGAGWGTDMHILRIHHEMKYRKAIKALFPLTLRQRVFVQQKIEQLRESFAMDFLHRLIHRRKIDRRVLMSQARLDPLSFLCIVPVALRSALLKLKSDHGEFEK